MQITYMSVWQFILYAKESNNIAFCPHSLFMGLVLFLKQTVGFLNITYRLIFVTDQYMVQTRPEMGYTGSPQGLEICVIQIFVLQVHI